MAESKQKMVAVTYAAQPGDPVTTFWHGVRFEHNKPVDVPEEHPMLQLAKGEDGKPQDGSSQAHLNPWFTVKGDKSQPKGDDKSQGGEETPEAYFRYAVGWLSTVTSSGALESRWHREEERRSAIGWSADDEERITPILQPKLETLKKQERDFN